MRKDSWIVEPRLLDAAHVIADVDAIRQYNPQRFEMEQLTAIIYEDADRHVCVGHKDLTADEFWVRGQGSHPIMPAVLMCEAAGQLANYYALRHRLYAVQGGFVGLKGVRYRRIAKPGERLFVIARLLKIRSTLLTCQFQCAVGRRVVCDGVLIGGGAAWMKDQEHDASLTTVAGMDVGFQGG